MASFFYDTVQRWFNSLNQTTGENMSKDPHDETATPEGGFLAITSVKSTRPDGSGYLGVGILIDRNKAMSAVYRMLRPILSGPWEASLKFEPSRYAPSDLLLTLWRQTGHPGIEVGLAELQRLGDAFAPRATSIWAGVDLTGTYRNIKEYCIKITLHDVTKWPWLG